MTSIDAAPTAPPSPAPLLELVNVSKVFGALRATDGVSIAVKEGENRALIGPNGAGKSTLFKLISGQLTPSEGAIHFEGKDITQSRAHERSRLGLAMTFQHSNLLDQLTVRENITIAVQRKMGVAGKWFSPIWNQKAVHARTDQLLEELSLQQKATKVASSLAYGERRRVELALAYATEPRLLLLDEPAAGMSPGEIEDFLEILLKIPNLTFVMIEHNIDVVMRIASTITVLDYGRVIADGSPGDVTKSDAVQKAYLGSSLGEDLFSDQTS